ncbi:MAG: hypothetical protein EA427_15300 [Spirochaetaceae bacterium]|nr:MAG: hypothetical protein EA427_15300 [Spirochaetaceae bacterium]
MKVPQRSVVLLLFFLSGFAALVYQVLWVRQLGLLFGNTAQASALTIAVFFSGLSMGGWFWGTRAPGGNAALRWFGLVEVGVAITALGHFVLLDIYHAAYPFMYDLFGHIPTVDLAVKILIAGFVLFPPAFLMGGTLPLMSEYLIRSKEGLGKTGTVLYAINTAGSALGVIAAGFFLPVAVGFRVSYILAVGVDLFVGASAVLLSRRIVPPVPVVSVHVNTDPRGAPAKAIPNRVPPYREIERSAVWVIAFISGFATLGVEVIWTRLFAQVLQNSVYTYAVVLTSFLLALACGAALAHGLCRITRLTPRTVITALLALASLVTAVTPWLFFERTSGLSYIGGSHDWAGYIMEVMGVAALVMFLPAVLLGTILPYLMRVLEPGREETAKKVGRLVAVDTLGAIFGSLSAGFVILPGLGAVQGLQLLSGVYLLGLTVFALTGNHRFRFALPVVAIAAYSLFVIWDPLFLATRAVGTSAGGRVVEFREGVSANVAVVDVGDGLAIRVNNYYTLGSSRALQSERNQTVIPMVLHPDPRSVFFLGMGTGITAGASLSFPVTEVVVCEIIDEVIDLARNHFQPYVNGLFHDPRVTIYAEDGRTCLSRSRARYDLIISDLFTPWKAGTGNLYTLEHYQTAAGRLNPGGLFVQWVPLYQVSFQEFGMIARTMTEVFPEVTLWRGDLFPSRSIVALIGSNHAGALDPEAVRSNAARVTGAAGGDESIIAHFDAHILRFYGGNITGSSMFEHYLLNTDTFPRVEYLAPRTHRAVQSGRGRFMVGFERQVLYRDLMRSLPPARDPHLRYLTDAQRGYVTAGFNYTYYNLYTYLRRREDASPFLERYLELIPDSISRQFSPAAALIPR